MSEISLILVLQNKNKQNSEWHGKTTNKIWETHSFWGIFFDYGAIWCSFSSNHRFHLGIEMHYVWLSYSEILRSLILRNGLRHHVGMYWTFTQTTMLMPTCSRQTLVKDHAFLVKPAYYLKSLYGVRGFCVYDVSVMQGICTIKWIFVFYKQNPTKPNRLRIWGNRLHHRKLFIYNKLHNISVVCCLFW